MAKQDAGRFLDYLNNDVAMLNQVLVLSNIDGIMDFAFVKGFVFTADEFRAALREAPASKAADKLRTKLNIQAQNQSAKTGNV